MSNTSEARTLLDLQEADYTVIRLKKQLDELPQRAKILELRAKRTEVQAKAAQVEHMRSEGERAVMALQDEERALHTKMEEAQHQIDASGDYKEVTNLSKEIEGLVKRAEKTEFDLLKQLERSDKVTEVEAQVASALGKLEHQEQELLGLYHEEGGNLQQDIALVQARRAEYAAALTPALLKRYDRAVAAKNGVGAAYLEDTHCSGCRVVFTDGQLAKLKQGPEINECPHCHRLLVVADPRQEPVD